MKEELLLKTGPTGCLDLDSMERTALLTARLAGEVAGIERVEESF